MATIADIIKQSYRLLMVIDPNETLSGPFGDAGRIALNRMLDAWNLEKLNTYVMSNDSYTATASTASFAIGSGQTWNGTRPVKIESAWVRVDGDDYQLDMINNEQYNLIADKDETGSYPTKLYYKPSYPYGTVYLWPVQTSSRTIGIQHRTKLSSYTATTTSFSLPEGYEAAMVYNLAVELMPEFPNSERDATLIFSKATEYKAMLKAAHNEPVYLTSDAIGLGHNVPSFDVYAGE